MNEELLDLYPLRECEYKVNSDKVTIIYDKFEKTFLDKIIKNKKKRIAKIDLDKIGSFVWLNCNGKKKVFEIIEETEQAFGDKEEKIKERAILFLNQLAQKKFIRFYSIK